MIKMFKQMKKSLGFILVIFGLLFLQAFCDLSLPEYTSRIVDTGIQQKGIEDAVPDQIRKEAMDGLLLLMKETDQTKVKDAYTLEGELYVRKDLTREERDEINGPMGEAMLIAAAVSQQNIDITQLPEEQRNAMMQQAEEKIDAMSDSIVTQAAVTYVQSEYAAQGRDVDQMQTNYVLQAGLQMLGLAAIAMLAAVLVTFLSSRVAASLGRDLRNKVYRKALSFSSSEMNHFSTASLITRSTNDIQQVQMVMTLMFRIVLYAPILGIGGVLKVLQTESTMTWVLGLGVGVILAVMLVLFAVAMPKFKNCRRSLIKSTW